MNTEPAITPLELTQRLAAFRRRPSSTCAARSVRARSKRHSRRDRSAPPKPSPIGSRDLEPWRPVVVYCVKGHEVGRERRRGASRGGLDARHLEGGLEAWRAAGGTRRAVRRADALGHARTAEDRPHRLSVARAALHRSGRRVLLRSRRGSARVRRRQRRDTVRRARRAVQAQRATGAASTRSSASTTLADAGARPSLATIVRGADTGALALAPQSAGLLATSHGLSALFADDHAMLRAGMMMYDALYVWCRRRRRRERRGRPPTPRPSATGCASAS